MRFLTVALVGLTAGLTACGGGGGGGDDTTADAPPMIPDTINVSGTTVSVGINGMMPIADVMIGSYREADTMPETTTTSDAQGNYTISLPTLGAPVEGYLIASLSGYKDTYLYPAGPLTADLSGAQTVLMTQSTFDLIPTVAQTTQPPGMGWIAIDVVDDQLHPIAGAVVTSTPAGVVRYNANGLPSKTPTMTDTDGIAYIFNVTAGPVTVAATAPGIAFHAHQITARADQVTTTLVAP